MGLEITKEEEKESSSVNVTVSSSKDVSSNVSDGSINSEDDRSCVDKIPTDKDSVNIDEMSDGNSERVIDGSTPLDEVSINSSVCAIVEKGSVENSEISGNSVEDGTANAVEANSEGEGSVIDNDDERMKRPDDDISKSDETGSTGEGLGSKGVETMVGDANPVLNNSVISSDILGLSEDTSSDDDSKAISDVVSIMSSNSLLSMSTDGLGLIVTTSNDNIEVSDNISVISSMLLSVKRGEGLGDIIPDESRVSVCRDKLSRMDRVEERSSSSLVSRISLKTGEGLGVSNMEDSNTDVDVSTGDSSTTVSVGNTLVSDSKSELNMSSISEEVSSKTLLV